jgi:aspartate kinase
LFVFPFKEYIVLVMKFGGTSLADASRFKDVLNIVRANCASGAGVVVLSAMSGVTNGLIACAQEAQAGNSASALEKLAILKARHLQVVDELFSDSAGGCDPVLGRHNRPPTTKKQPQWGDAIAPYNLAPTQASPLQEKLEADFNKLGVLLQGIAYLGELSKRSLDAISSCGELLSSQIFAAFAQGQGFPARFVDARSFIITNNDFGRAFPIMPEIVSRCQAQSMPVIKKGECVITQGFVGATADGDNYIGTWWLRLHCCFNWRCC